MQSPGLGFGQRISALEAEVAQLKRQVERLLSNPVVPTVVPTTVIAARGLEFINVGGTTPETFEKHVASLKRVLQSISNVNCAVYTLSFHLRHVTMSRRSLNHARHQQWVSSCPLTTMTLV